MSKHTPGPWRAHDHNDMAKLGSDPNVWIGYAWVGHGGDESGRFQGKVADLDRRKDGSKEYRERASADAKLIAAAPELLEAVRQYLAVIDLLSLPDDEVTITARAAFTKATA